MAEIAIVILVIMLVLLLLGFPMKVPLLMSAIAVIVLYFPDVDSRVVVQRWIGGIQPSSLIAVPMFILAADVMTRGQAADRLLDAVMKCVGHMRGGLPITSAISCTAFGAISGSTQATVVAIGGPLRPRLLKAGYSDSFTSALIINASDIALLIPPSIGMIVYGVVAKASIGELFIAGIGPGLLILLFFCIYCYIASIRLKIPRQEKATPTDRTPLLIRINVYTIILLVGAIRDEVGMAATALLVLIAATVLETRVYRTIPAKHAIRNVIVIGGVTTIIALVAGALLMWLAHFLRETTPPQELAAATIYSFAATVFCVAAAVGVTVPWLRDFGKTTLGASLQRALWPLGFPVIIIGGIYGGIFSPTEAAAISVLYAVILELVVFGELSHRDLPKIALNSGLVTAVVFVLVGAGAAFSWVISFANLPEYLIGLDETSGYWTIMLTIAGAYFIGCMFVDPIVVILILTPIFAPIAAAAGIDPILVGVVVTMQVAIGSATPPFGCDIFTAIAIFRRPYFDVIKGTPPFIIILLASAVLVIAVPDIALFLRDMAFPPDQAP